MFPDQQQGPQPDPVEPHNSFVPPVSDIHPLQPEPPTHHQPLYPEPARGFASSATPVFEDKPTHHHAAADDAAELTDDKPMPVVKVLSVRGVEYGMMTISLWIAAASVAASSISIINGQASFGILAFPISTLLGSLPAFAFFFLRLKKAELADPSLRLEPSKRRFSQLTQFVAFIVCMINAIFFIYLVMSSFGNDNHVSWGKSIGTLLVIFVVAGGILAYYWQDEHRLVAGK